MRKIVVDSLSKRDCIAVKKALEGKTRYHLFIDYTPYTERKYRLSISTENEIVCQYRFDDVVLTALIRALRKATDRKMLNEGK